jgi:hypothetical protein
VQIIALLELAAERGREQGRDCGFAGSGDAHANGDHWSGDGVRDGCGPHALTLAITSHHALIRDNASASADRLSAADQHLLRIAAPQRSGTAERPTRLIQYFKAACKGAKCIRISNTHFPAGE